jgi:hypothetical protein
VFVRLSFALAAVALLLWSAEASAEVGISMVRAGEGGSPEPERPSGTSVMLASAVYPGLGQLMNGAETKSAVVSAVEALLVTGLLVEDRRTRNAFRLYEETGASEFYDDYSQHYDRRQALIWWVALAALYGLTDAYVDANLADFDSLPVFVPESPFETSDRNGAELRFQLAFRF